MAPQKPYVLSLERCGADILASVNRRSVLCWRDSQPRPELCHLGIDNGGQKLVAENLAVYSPAVRNFIFDTAPTDWIFERGVWSVSSRWSCAPQWAWLCGVSPQETALAAMRQSFTGDVEARAYFAAKMIQRGNTTIEKLTDVYFGCAAPAGRADGGYLFIVGAEDNKHTLLLRNGQLVASCPYRLAQELIHNDWLRLTIRRRGPQLMLFVWDSLILSWTDPQPLPGGRIVLGTARNGIVVPRVTIFGQPYPAPESVLAQWALRQPASAAAAPPALSRPMPAPVSPGPDTREKGGEGPPAPRPLLMFTEDRREVEFGGYWGLWPQQPDCQGVATFQPGQDAEGLPGGCMKVEYTIKAAPRSFSLWLTAGSNPMDLSAYDRFVLYLRGNVPSMTLVVKDATASDTDPDNPQGVAEYIIRGITAQWRNFEAPFAQFRPRQAGGRINWRAIKHIGLAMIAPQNAESGTFWADNLRACAGPYRPQR